MMLFFCRGRESNERKFRNARHGSEIAERPHHRFPANSARIRFAGKMNLFNDAIGFQQQPILRAAKFDHRTIVPGSNHDPRITIKPGKNLCEQFVFTEFAQRPRHCCKVLGKASARRVMALKMACIVIETNNDPLHS